MFRSIKNDAHRARWSLAGFGVIVMVALTGLQSIEPIRQFQCVDECTSKNSEIQLVLFLVFIAGILFIPAQVVQFDSPLRIDAFWRSQPVNSARLAAAKLLLAVPTIPIVLSIAQALGIALIGLPVGASLYGVGLTGYYVASLTMLASLIAALAPNVRAYVFTLIGFSALRMAFYSSYMLGDWLTSYVYGTPTFRGDIWFLLAAALFYWTYLSRIRVLRTKRIALAVGICVLTVGWDSGEIAGVRFLTRTNEIANESLPGVRISGQISGEILRIGITAPAPSAGSRFVYVRVHPTLQFADGTERLLSGNGRDDVALVPKVSMLSGVTNDPKSVTGSFLVPLDASTVFQLKQQSARVLLSAFLVEQRDTILGQFAAVTDSSATFGADRLIIRSASYDTLPKAIGVEQLHIGPAPKFATVAWQYQRHPDNVDWAEGVPYTVRLADSQFQYFGIYGGGHDTLALAERREGGSGFPLVFPITSVSRPFVVIGSRDPQRTLLRVPNWLTPDTRILVRQWKYQSYKPLHDVLVLPRQSRSIN